MARAQMVQSWQTYTWPSGYGYCVCTITQPTQRHMEVGVMGRKRRRRTEIERLSENGGNAKTFQDVTMKRTVKQIGTEANKGIHKNKQTKPQTLACTSLTITPEVLVHFRKRFS